MILCYTLKGIECKQDAPNYNPQRNLSTGQLLQKRLINMGLFYYSAVAT